MKSKTYIFWISSSRGTDSQQIIRLDASLKRSAIKDELEHWCSNYGAWNKSENMVQYGWTKASKGNLTKLKQYYDMQSKKREKTRRVVERAITSDAYCSWLKKHKKRLAFPFK